MVPAAEHQMRHAISDKNYFRKTFSALRKFPRVTVGGAFAAGPRGDRRVCV